MIINYSCTYVAKLAVHTVSVVLHRVATVEAGKVAKHSQGQWSMYCPPLRHGKICAQLWDISSRHDKMDVSLTHKETQGACSGNLLVSLEAMTRTHPFNQIIKRVTTVPAKERNACRDVSRKYCKKGQLETIKNLGAGCHVLRLYCLCACIPCKQISLLTVHPGGGGGGGNCLLAPPPPKNVLYIVM